MLIQIKPLETKDVRIIRTEKLKEFLIHFFSISIPFYLFFNFLTGKFLLDYQKISWPAKINIVQEALYINIPSLQNILSLISFGIVVSIFMFSFSKLFLVFNNKDLRRNEKIIYMGKVYKKEIHSNVIYELKLHKSAPEFKDYKKYICNVFVSKKMFNAYEEGEFIEIHYSPKSKIILYYNKY